MKSKNKKIITALTALAMTFSMCTGVSAETLLDFAQSNVTPESETVFLNYDPESEGFELVNEDGEAVETEDTSEQSSEETDTEVKTDRIKVNTPSSVISAAAAAVAEAPLSVTTPPVTTVPAVTTVPRSTYIARYRYQARSEVAAMTTAKPPVTTARKTTVRATTTVKTTTTTKPVTKSVYKGIDVSRHQGDINWTKVKKAGIDFVMIRAGYGKYSDQVDLKFKENIAAAQKAGISCGVYWYSYALTTADALKEAKVCYDTIKNYKLDYPVAYDVEDPTQMSLTVTQISNIIKVFCDYLENRKYYVTVYSFASMLKDKMNSSVLTSYDIWVAHINVSKPNYSGKYGMWQYSHTGRVDGISTVVDLDYSYKQYPDIMKKNKLNGYT